MTLSLSSVSARRDSWASGLPRAVHRYPPARFLGAESYLVWQCLDCVLWGVEGQRPCCGHLSVPVTGAQSYNARVVGSELLEGN